MSRRDFFARVGGRDPARDPSGPPATGGPRVLHTFYVASFPYHDGPVLVPSLRVGEEFSLVPDPPYSRTPTAARIDRGRDHLGYVPAEMVEEVLARMKAGESLICRAKSVDPSAELPRVLLVEIVLPPPVADSTEDEESRSDQTFS